MAGENEIVKKGNTTSLKEWPGVEGEIVRGIDALAPSWARTAQEYAEVMEAQRQAVVVAWKPWFDRHHVREFKADATGLTQGGTVRFFANAVEQNGNGFARQLTRADTSMDAAGGQMPAAQMFVAFAMGIMVDPTMPRPIAQQLIYGGAISFKRNATYIDLGGADMWSAGGYGVRSTAVATTGGTATFEYMSNGTNGLIELAPDSRIFLLPKQQVLLTFEANAQFFETTDGLVLTPNQNTLIPNNGEIGEAAGTFKLILRGYHIQLN